MLTYQQILNDLKNKIYHPVYFLFGEESYYIDKITSYIEKNVLTEAEQTFNQTILYGKDTDMPAIINTAKRFPMMANHQVVIVKEAQNIKQLDPLVYYLEHPLKSTILVINYKYQKLDKRTKLFKLLKEKSVLFESQRLYEDKIPAWIENYLKERGLEMEPGIGMVLTDFLGNDLSKIVNELEKLRIVLPEGEKKITADLVERNIGISKEFNNFELTKALARKDILKCNRIIRYFCDNPKNNPITLTLSFLYYFFSKVLMVHFAKDKSREGMAAALKVPPYFLQDYSMAARQFSSRKVALIISDLRQYDLRSKGIGNASMSDCELLRELIYKILH